MHRNSNLLLLCLWVLTAKLGLCSDAVEVFHQGEAGFTCIRAPATIQVQNGVLLTFAAGRCYQGDNCYPQKDALPAQDKKDYGAFIMKRSVDGGKTWSEVVEIFKGNSSKNCSLRSSLEGAPFFDTRTNTTLVMWSSKVVGNLTTGLALWQAESKDAGLTWSTPHPVRIPALVASDVHNKTHIPPGSGIQLRHPNSQHYGRLVVVLILQAKCTEDVVIYSDDVGQTWSMSKTRLMHNGEAQVAEVGADELIFDGRSHLGSGAARGVSKSTDGGETFAPPIFVHDATSGVNCLASLLALPTPKASPSPTDNIVPLLFSHPAAKNRSQGVVLQSTDGAQSWSRVAMATPESPGDKFGYSSLTLLGAGEIGGGGAMESMVGLTYETSGGTCTASTSACRIMYRNITF